MGVPIHGGLQQFEEYCREFGPLQRLSAFFLFDERASHAYVEQFAATQFKWLDHLASNAQMFLFIPRRSDAGHLSNPSIAVAKLFDVSVSSLPGIVFFALDEQGANVNGSFFVPFEISAFDDAVEAEALIAGLFSLIASQDRHASSSPGVRLDALREAVKRARRQPWTKRALQPIGKIRDGTLSIATIAAQAFARTVGEAAARQF